MSSDNISSSGGSSTSFIFVHYHAAALLGRAVEAVLADLARSGFTGEIVVVDNGSNDNEKSLLRSMPVRCIDNPANTGYAAALNLGIADTRGEYLFLMNPDVFVCPGCVPALVRELGDGAAAAGPRLYWDVDRQFLLPPTEERTPVSEVATAIADWGDAAEHWARQRWRKHAYRHWLAPEPIRSEFLSGALFAIRREAMATVGPFDEGFPLYFEEQDWLTRLTRTGLTSLYVPAAEAVHLFNQSAAYEPMASSWEAESAARYAAKHSPGWLRWTIPKIRPHAGRRGTCPAVMAGFPPTLPIGTMRAAGCPEWIEVSPLARGFPAAAARLGSPPVASWTFPESVMNQMAPGNYLLTVCSSRGSEVFRGLFRRP